MWHGTPVHRAQPLMHRQAAGRAERILAEQLSGQAPELNPDEGTFLRLRGRQPRAQAPGRPAYVVLDEAARAVLPVPRLGVQPVPELGKFWAPARTTRG